VLGIVVSDCQLVVRHRGIRHDEAQINPSLKRNLISTSRPAITPLKARGLSSIPNLANSLFASHYRAAASGAGPSGPQVPSSLRREVSQYRHGGLVVA
jgi:hypothetical protein